MATPIPANRARFTLEEVVRATNGTSRGGASSGTAEGVVSDSRAVVPGSVFVALRGEAHDGHRFAAQAARSGARVLVVERGRDLGDVSSTVVVEVDDTLVAWGALAGAHLARWRASGSGRSVVAITGSAGKTTTKELAAALLGEIAPTHRTAGNLNNRVGVPAVIFALEDEHRFLVLEMGMSLPGELDAITGFARPDVAVVTNVGVAHSEGVGGRDGVMREKGAVYRALDEDGVAIVNADDAYVLRAAEGSRARRTETFGLSSSASHRLVSRAHERGGSRVVLRAGERELTVHLPLPGEAAAIDLAAALAAAEAASGELLSAERADRALAGVRVAGRGTVLELGDVTVLDDTYNANPASMRAALATLAEIAGPRRRVAVLGEMKELGALAAKEHEELGDALASAGVSLAIGCGGLVDLALDRAARGGVEVVRAPDTETAAAETTRRVLPGDVVLVKASRSVRAERVIEALLAATK